MSWLERVASRRVLNRYEAHQVVAAAFGNSAGRYLWDYTPNGLIVRHGNARGLDWPRGFTVVDRERERVPVAGEELELAGVVSAVRTDAFTGARHAVSEREFPEWLTRQAERSGLRFVSVPALDRVRDQVVRPRDSRSLVWSGFRFVGVFTVVDSELWVTARELGWGKARAFGFGMLRPLAPEARRESFSRLVTVLVEEIGEVATELQNDVFWSDPVAVEAAQVASVALTIRRIATHRIKELAA